MSPAARGSPPASTGLRFPTGDQITPFHLMLRCRVEAHPECEADATRELLDLAANLETPFDGPGMTDPDAPLVAGTLTVVYSGAAFPWGAADGSSGVATAIAVDLAPLLRESSAYAVLQTPEGIIRYALPLGQTYQLFETLYIGPLP